MLHLFLTETVLLWLYVCTVRPYQVFTVKYWQHCCQ